MSSDTTKPSRQLKPLPIRPRILSIQQLVLYANSCKSVIYAEAKAGRLKLVKNGGRSSGCELSEADRWIDSRIKPMHDAPKIVVAAPSPAQDEPAEPEASVATADDARALAFQERQRKRRVKPHRERSAPLGAA